MEKNVTYGYQLYTILLDYALLFVMNHWLLIKPKINQPLTSSVTKIRIRSYSRIYSKSETK